MADNSRLVYSTESGRIKHPKEKNNTKTDTNGTPIDGIVRIFRQTKGRKGKGVSIVTGLPLSEVELKQLAKQLKQLCGTGGSVKNGTIEIQGDNREKLKKVLEQQGYTVKLAGG